MNAATSGLQHLRSDHPEWNPWLSVVDQAVREAANPAWESMVPNLPQQQEPHAPALAEAAIALARDVVDSWLKRLLRSASASGTPAMATLPAAAKPPLEPVRLFTAALCQDTAELERIAAAAGADAGAFRSVAELLPIPFLQACGRKLPPRDDAGRTAGYCPICGAWPAFAEVRGIERARYLRCSRCGEEWRIHWLQCPFCGMNDHEQLLSLVPQNGDSGRAIDACKRCSGYLKSLTMLQGADRLEVMIKDLASVDLDIAAVEQGYRRPPGPGYALHVAVECRQSALRRFFPRGR